VSAVGLCCILNSGVYVNRWLVVCQLLYCAVFSDSYCSFSLPITEPTAITEHDYIMLGYCISLTASELLNVYTAEWQL